MRILIVDDEKLLVEALCEILTKNNYLVDYCFDGEDGYKTALTGIYDVILLDIMMPKINGLEVLKRLRAKKVITPIILLTAKSNIDDKVAGLDCGADDYLTKPFVVKELLARIRSAARRKEYSVSDEMIFGDLTMDKNSMKLSRGGNEIQISQKEFQILEILIKNAGHTVSKEQFVESIWGYDFNGEYNIVEVYISFVRKKMKAIQSALKIRVVRNIGYSLEPNHD